MKTKTTLLIFIFLCSTPLFAQEDGSIVTETSYSAFEFRNIGPALFWAGMAILILSNGDNTNDFIKVWTVKPHIVELL